ncbi:MAG: hypothetical protein ACRC62_36820 [Microcoleus sp.]
MNSWLLPVRELEASDRAAMYALLENHFQGITWEVFQSDLERKNWVLLLKDETSHTLKGFTTLMFCQTRFAGEKISIVYSGDTIVDPSAWSSTALPRNWIAAIDFLHQKYPDNKLYWLLICSGFRTYRFLPTFWQEFYPRYDAATPDRTANLMANLVREYYGNFYQETLGIVRFPHPQILGDKLIEIPTGRQTNPHIQFFEKKNPGYRLGDELVCFTEIRYDNLTRAGKRMWQANSSLKFLQNN